MAWMTAGCATYDLNTDKGEVGGSSPPRPTIQITNIYAAILTFLLSGTCHQETVLPKICQKFELAIDPVFRGLRCATRMKHPKSATETWLICSILEPRCSL